jgi:uncharacterized membrane protein
MNSFVAGLAAALATIASAAPAQNEAKLATAPKVYLAGDSTMALGGGGTGTQVMSLVNQPVASADRRRMGSLSSIFSEGHNGRERRHRRHISAHLLQRIAL